MTSLRLSLSFAFGWCVGAYAATGERWAVVTALAVLFVRVVLFTKAIDE